MVCVYNAVFFPHYSNGWHQLCSHHAVFSTNHWIGCFTNRYKCYRHRRGKVSMFDCHRKGEGRWSSGRGWREQAGQGVQSSSPTGLNAWPLTAFAKCLTVGRAGGFNGHPDGGGGGGGEQLATLYEGTCHHVEIRRHKARHCASRTNSRQVWRSPLLSDTMYNGCRGPATCTNAVVRGGGVEVVLGLYVMYVTEKAVCSDCACMLVFVDVTSIVCTCACMHPSMHPSCVCILCVCVFVCGEHWWCSGIV